MLVENSASSRRQSGHLSIHKRIEKIVVSLAVKEKKERTMTRGGFSSGGERYEIGLKGNNS